MHGIFLYLESISPSQKPVLITGETGVGKELIAGAIHKLSQPHAKMITVNIAGLDDFMFSDTLFGHTRGAFTGAQTDRQGLVDQARDSTLFLDEIGDLSATSQIKLLRLIDSGEYLPLGSDISRKTDVQLVAATNVDLWALVREGRFRADLNFRLRIHHVHIPLLRERREDIPPLVNHFLAEAAEDLNKKKPTVPRELFTLLNTYSFPGNIRELKTVVYQAVAHHRSRMLSLDGIKGYIHQFREVHIKPVARNRYYAPVIDFPRELPTIKEVTELLIDETLSRSKGNLTLAANMLGISRQALSKRLKLKGKSQTS